MHNQVAPHQAFPKHGGGFSICAALLFLLSILTGFAQVDPMKRNQVQLGYDQPLQGRGPQAAYIYYYLNLPEFLQHTNMALRLAVAPAYFDGELGIRGVITPHTDIGIGVAGGAFGDNYYEVRQGDYIRSESFDGYGGGTSLSIYHRINPRQMIPLNTVMRIGERFSTYNGTSDTANNFELPEERTELFTRVGLRLAGNEPRLYSDLGMELSVWFERRWRLPDDEYGFSNDRSVNEAVNLYWVYAGLNYAWTNSGHSIHFAVTAGGSENPDRFSAWRLGGVLPLAAEFPLILPGYYYQEISAERFVHMAAAYAVSLDSTRRWQLRFEAATARVDYLQGFEQSDDWHTGAGAAVVYTSCNKVLKIALRYGYGFNAVRDDDRGAQSVGILLQYDFQALKEKRSKGL